MGSPLGPSKENLDRVRQGLELREKLEALEAEVIILATQRDELSDRLDLERQEHEATKGYRQLAEEDREHLRRLLGKLDPLPEDPPTFAPEGYAVELSRVVEILLAHADPTEGMTVSQVVERLVAQDPEGIRAAAERFGKLPNGKKTG